MGIITNLISATVKTVLVPIAVVKDAVEVVKWKEPENTKELLKSAVEDLKDAGDTLLGENDEGIL